MKTLINRLGKSRLMTALACWTALGLAGGCSSYAPSKDSQVNQPNYEDKYFLLLEQHQELEKICCPLEENLSNSQYELRKVRSDNRELQAVLVEKEAEYHEELAK